MPNVKRSPLWEHPTQSMMVNRMVSGHRAILRALVEGRAPHLPDPKARQKYSTLERWKAIKDGQVTNLGQVLLMLYEEKHGYADQD